MLAVGWFPQHEWEVAIDRWPSLAAEMPADHAAYRAAIQQRVQDLRTRMTGVRLVMVELSVAALDRGAADDNLDAGSAELRGRVATAAALNGKGRVWPPGRNNPCWCGSTRKYKQCCDTARS